MEDRHHDAGLYARGLQHRIAVPRREWRERDDRFPEACVRSQARFTLFVPDVDAAYRRAIEAGATSVQAPVQKLDDEDKRGGVKDDGGNDLVDLQRGRLDEVDLCRRVSVGEPNSVIGVTLGLLMVLVGARSQIVRGVLEFSGGVLGSTIAKPTTRIPFRAITFAT
jgi:hypothetical protein